MTPRAYVESLVAAGDVDGLRELAKLLGRVALPWQSRGEGTYHRWALAAAHLAARVELAETTDQDSATWVAYWHVREHPMTFCEVRRSGPAADSDRLRLAAMADADAALLAAGWLLVGPVGSEPAVERKEEG